MIFFRCLGAVLLLLGLAFCLVLAWDQHHARVAAAGYLTSYILALSICAVAVGVLFLRRVAAVIAGAGLASVSAYLLIGPITGRVGAVGVVMTAICAIPLLCVVGGIIYCRLDLKGW